MYLVVDSSIADYRSSCTPTFLRCCTSHRSLVCPFCTKVFRPLVQFWFSITQRYICTLCCHATLCSPSLAKTDPGCSKGCSKGWITLTLPHSRIVHYWVRFLWHPEYQGRGRGYQPRLRLITLTETLIILDITKTESYNCSIIHWTKPKKEMEVMFLLFHWQQTTWHDYTQKSFTTGGHTGHDYLWPWVSLTWLLYNLLLDDVTGADFGQSEKR